MRADFYPHAAAYPVFAQAVSTHQYLVGPLGRDELRQVIEQPALAAGLALQPGLVEVVLDDVESEPGALPLLEHALLELWERRQADTLTLAAYAETGGVAGAVSTRADQIWASFTAARTSGGETDPVASDPTRRGRRGHPAASHRGRDRHRHRRRRAMSNGSCTSWPTPAW